MISKVKNMKLLGLLIYISFLVISIPVRAEFDPNKINRNLEKIEIPDFSIADKNKAADIPKLSVKMLKNLPQDIDSLNLADAPLKLRGGKNIYASKADSVVKILTKEGSGSGAVISKNGLIITNWHVITGYETVGVILLSDSEVNPEKPKWYLADVIKTDPKVDLALVRIQKPPKTLSAFSLGNIPEIGSDVHAIGHPIGAD